MEHDHGSGRGAKTYIILLAAALFIAGIVVTYLASRWAIADLSTAGLLIIVSSIMIGVLAAINPDKHESH